MANKGVKNSILSLSPKIELFVRKLYKNNVKFLAKFNKNKVQVSQLTDFEKISTALKTLGVSEGRILVLHSSYEVLEGTGLSPLQVIDKLISLIGDNGTLVMNSARRFPEEVKHLNDLDKDYGDEVVTYNVKKSRVWTGTLPFFMLRHKDALISKFPINPVVAIGKQAKEMVKDNLTDLGTSCGINSAWKYCVDNDAIVVGIGIDLTHSLTIIHVAEDMMGDKWPIPNWYRKRKFKIIDVDGTEILTTVKERRPIWGSRYFAERTLCKDLLNEGILKSLTVDGVLIEAVDSKVLIEYLNSKNETGYPYFGIKKFIK
ncbi:AAC(3) family N-acetyltransferase [Mucilaginibacter boryungensis]|uniref:Aminoglycoside N(3)-acetyltransferase n=1 Tax=Mucilaginibacter boryungensis TaxID=768480 RepID=A0ABR9XEN6_9SPHI|nr:AAC(3) family N-acetyltransferase [Mucilaginibacter boryungensis]MBE9665838.1 AAC(3) family N-acetyltransferase [Mucilaginibacter boryungensis]